jgi:hypothetical protein
MPVTEATAPSLLRIARVDAWLSQACDVVAREAGIDSSEIGLDPEDEQALLELARIAAHRSGERTNAPLLCYLAGFARVDLDRLVAAVEEIE